MLGPGDRPRALALRVTALLLILGACSAFVPHPVCKVEGHETEYDVTSLTRGEEDAPYFAKSPHGHYHYHFNFCGHAKGCNQQPSCQARMSTDGSGKPKENIATVTTTGELYMMKWEEMDEADLKMVNDELKLQSEGAFDHEEYTAGLKVSYQIGPKQRKTVIRLPCERDAKNGFTVNDPNFDPKDLEMKATVVEKPILTYNIIFPTVHSCKKGWMDTKVDLHPNRLVHSKSHFFAFLFFIILILYCCAGCYYKRERLGAQGMEMIPHIDSITGCWDTVRGAGSGDSAVGGLLNRARGVNDDGL